MALSNTTNRYQTGTLSGIVNGNTVATWGSRISAESDLKVYVVESDGTTTLLTLDVDYEIDPTLNGTLITSCDINVLDATKFPDDSIVIVIRETNFLQSSDYATNGVILSDTLENDLDKLAMQTQQLKDDITRSVRFSATLTSTPDPEISFDATARSNKVLGFDADGDFAVTQELGTFVGDWTDGTDYQTRDIVRTWGDPNDKNYGSVWIAKQSHTASTGNAPDNTYPLASNDYWELILDTGHFATQAGLAELASTTSTGKATEAEDWANKIDGDVVVDEVASGEYSAKAYAIGGTGVTGAAGSAKDWAIKTDGTVDGTNYSAKYWATRADVGTVAGLDTEIQAVAAISSDVSTVSGISSDVTTVAADGTDIGIVATNIANVNSVAGVSSNVTTVATNIANVNTVAGVSANVTTVAGVSADVTSVAGVSTKVTTVADNIDSVNTVATGIADVNRYADEYTISTTEPTGPLEGDLWYDSTNNVLKVRTATAWAVIEAVPQPLATTDSPTFTTVNATTVNSTNLEVTNIKANDGTSAGSIADSTGIVTLASSVLTTADINGGTIDDATIGGNTPAAGSFTQVNVGDGTAATPSITNTGDTDTGIYFPAADTIGLCTVGIERLRIDSSGNVRANKIIDFAGTGAPYFQYGLTVNSGAATTPSITNTGDTNTGIYFPAPDTIGFCTGGVECMRIDSSGNVRANKIINMAGTGAPNFPNGLTNNNSLVYSRSNILDTVSQSAGIPTGGIIERGSNSNGEYVKFADGTLICTQIISGTTNTATTTITGAIVYYVEVTWNFPVAFASATAPVVVVSGSDSNGSNATLNGSATTTSATIWIYKANNSNSVQCNAIAIGRWY